MTTMTNLQKKEHLHSSVFSVRHKLIRAIWGTFYIFFFKFTPPPFFTYRNWVLRLFGAKLAKGARVYPTARIWLPRNLSMSSGSTIGPNTTIYNQGKISIGGDSIISQGAHLCASTHNYNHPLHPLVLAPIVIGDNAWICADAFIGPGVTIADGGVIGARSVTSKNTDPWSVYAGNPSRKVNTRKIFK